MHEILLSFVFVFFAALPGRTTFILLLMSTTTSHQKILFGSIPAFTFQCAVAVLAGHALKTVPHRYVEFAAGLLFIYFAFKFWRESRVPVGIDKPSSGLAREDDSGTAASPAAGPSAGSDFGPAAGLVSGPASEAAFGAPAERSVSSIFLLFFLAELGDVSQLAVAARASQVEQQWPVFFGASAAMAFIAFAAVFAGRSLAKYAEPRILQQAAAWVFFAFGSYILYQACMA